MLYPFLFIALSQADLRSDCIKSSEQFAATDAPNRAAEVELGKNVSKAAVGVIRVLELDQCLSYQVTSFKQNMLLVSPDTHFYVNTRFQVRQVAMSSNPHDLKVASQRAEWPLIDGSKPTIVRVNGVVQTPAGIKTTMIALYKLESRYVVAHFDETQGKYTKPVEIFSTTAPVVSMQRGPGSPDAPISIIYLLQRADNGRLLATSVSWYHPARKH